MPFPTSPQEPNFDPNGPGRLATDRWEFEAHLEGINPPYATNFRHDAATIDVEPALVIGGVTCITVQQALAELNTLITTPTVPPATATSLGTIQLSGDLYVPGSVATAPKVGGLQGRPVSSLPPSTGQVLTWTGTTWAPSNSTGFVASGDLSGNATSQTVIGIQGNPVPTPSGTNTVLSWTGSTFSWSTATGFTAGGDLTGTNVSQQVIAWTGTGAHPSKTVNAHNDIVLFDTTSTPSIQQSSTTNSTGANLTLIPQQSTGTNQAGGNLVVSFQVPTGSGAESYIQTIHQSVPTVQIGRITNNASTSGIYLNSVAGGLFTPSNINYNLAGNRNNTTLNAPNGSLFMSLANTTAATIISSGMTLSNPLTFTISSLGGFGNGFATINNSGTIGFTSGISPTGAAGGDLSGTYPNPTVVGLRGHAVSSTAPSTGQVLEWNGTAWTPTSLGGGFVVGGDLTGASGAQWVTDISGSGGGGGPVTMLSSAFLSVTQGVPIIAVAGTTSKTILQTVGGNATQLSDPNGGANYFFVNSVGAAQVIGNKISLAASNWTDISSNFSTNASALRVLPWSTTLSTPTTTQFTQWIPVNFRTINKTLTNNFYSFTLNTNQAAMVEVYLTGRTVVGGSFPYTGTGVTMSGHFGFTVYNAGGTLTIPNVSAGGNATPPTLGTSTQGSSPYAIWTDNVYVGFGTSLVGTTVNLLAGPPVMGGAPTIDWQAIILIIYN